MIDPPIALRSICRKNDLLLNDDQMGLLARFAEGLVEWNTRINLISRRDVGNIWFSHILHSIAPLFSIVIPEGWRILDLGSGGGLPGIPLAIVRPDLSITLLDSIRKKSAASGEIVSTLGLMNVSVRTGRAEEIAAEKGLAKFDMVIARAVAHLEDLVRWSRPLVRSGAHTAGTTAKGGGNIQGGLPAKKFPAPQLLALKGGDLDAEIDAAQRKGSVAITVINVNFEGSLELGLEDKKLILVNFPQR